MFLPELIPGIENTAVIYQVVMKIPNTSQLQQNNSEIMWNVLRQADLKKPCYSTDLCIQLLQ